MVSINACYENKGSLPVLIDVNEILSNLLVEIKVAHGLDMDGEYCLYDKKADRYFSVEEMDWALKDFKGDSNFLKGGKVVNIEKGRPIGSNEISIKVSLYKRESHLTLYLEKSATVGQVRAAACEKFSCELELQMTSDKYALYLTDSFGEPDHWLKSDEKELGKEKKFSPNQKLILKPKELLAPSEIFKLQIFLTTTGSPDDFLFL